jgi:4-hydroxy-tetrahydrodipicolinate reductase
MLRVVECFTGGVGSEVVRLLDGHPHLRLVGVLVYGEGKAGLDAGELVGGTANSVRTTRDLDDVLRLAPDCAIWMGRGWEPDALCRLLRAGINVYAPIGAWYLPGDPCFDQMESACVHGGATLVGGGSIPGLISDVLPLFLSGYVGRIEHIRAQQNNMVGGYPSATQLRDGLGFGAPIPDGPATGDNPVDRKWIRYIEQSARMIADALSIDFDRLELTSKEFVEAQRDITLISGLFLPKGSAAGVRWTFTAYSRGRPFYTLIKEQTAVVGLGAGWRESLEEPQWRVEIDGTPSLRCAMSSSAPEGLGVATAQLNAARAVNLVPRIVAASPGCKSVLDFPAATGTAVVGSGW